MKRIVIILLLIISIIWGYAAIVKGFSISAIGFNIYSYSELGEQSEELTVAVAAYNKKNNTEFETVLSELDDAIDEYQDAKEEYESIIEELSTTETSEDSEEIIVASSFPVYEIDFLWATIGGYAKKEGLVITMDVNQNTAVSDTLGYDLYNLNFICEGEYINIADFLYDIEDDDQLGFEIRDYAMIPIIAEEDDKENGIEEGDVIGTQATFTIYNVPLNSATLIETVEETTEESEDSDNSVNNTSNTSSSNSTNSTNSTNTSNSTNSSNNTTN